MFRPVALFLLNLAAASAFDARRVIPPINDNGMRSIVYFLDGVRDTIPPGTCSWRTRSVSLDKDDPIEWWAFYMESSGFGLPSLGAVNASRSYLDFDFSDCTEDLAVAVYNNTGVAPAARFQDRDSGPFNSPQLSFGLGGNINVPNGATRPPTCVKRNGVRECGVPYNGQNGNLAGGTRFYLAIVVQRGDSTEFLNRFTPARYGYGGKKGSVMCNYRFRFCAFDPRAPRQDDDDEKNNNKDKKDKKSSKKSSKKDKRDRQLFEDVRNL